MKDSQVKQIKAYLLKGGKLTPLDALSLFGCFRLSGRIHDIRDEGIAVKTTYVKRNGKVVAEYSL